jgi:hypothetical protein
MVLDYQTRTTGNSIAHISIWELGRKFLTLGEEYKLYFHQHNHLLVFRGGVYRTRKKGGEKYEEVTTEGRFIVLGLSPRSFKKFGITSFFFTLSVVPCPKEH